MPRVLTAMPSDVRVAMSRVREGGSVGSEEAAVQASAGARDQGGVRCVGHCGNSI